MLSMFFSRTIEVIFMVHFEMGFIGVGPEPSADERPFSWLLLC